MDVLEYEKARIRMCRTMILKEGGCEACPLFNGLKRRCGFAASIAENMDENAIRKNIDIVIKWAKDHPVKTRQSEFLKDIVKLKYFAKWLKAIPTIDPESLRPTAHWKRIQDAAYMCTYCKSCFAFIPYNYQYCPECGAKMLNAYAFARER
uniref:Hydrogenase/urease nickel incorporation protein n=1 Tax=Ackermannviridae sp. TaxID=2831612 RepID=A0A8S5VKA1_9CAUD|nr:MAG TPA: hydrogenase/urease nickel incorporation protein [Ackermannviridae sp.]